MEKVLSSLPLISFCIPTYNGANYIDVALRSILTQSPLDQIEIIINDDCSADQTISIVNSIAESYPCIKVFENKQNLGMDRNFYASTQKATGTFIWMSGQDDIFQEGAITKFLVSLEVYPEVNFVYFNYRFLRDDLVTEVQPPPLSLEEDVYYSSAEDYFKQIDHPPSFLPAAILRREFWETTDVQEFLGTHYIQVGVWLENFNRGNILVVSNPNFIVCRMPDGSWKESGGQMLFEIFLGTLKVYHHNVKSKNKSLPSHIYKSFEASYIKTFMGAMVNFSKIGQKKKWKDLKTLWQIFRSKPIIGFLYLYPVYIMPAFLRSWIYSLLIKLRNHLFRGLTSSPKT